MSKPPRGLGKGLSALLPTRQETVTPPPAADPAPPTETIITIPIDQIEPNPVQPRRAFDSGPLQELAQSIRANGIIQPLVVRRLGERLQLVAGERRLRAAKLAGVKDVPVVVQDIPDDRLLEITLIENVQREDLNPIETAMAFDRMALELNMAPDEIGQRTGKDRTTIINLIRILQLPQEVKDMVAERKLTVGHARNLLSLPTAALRREVAEKAVARGWSVRELERFTKKLTEAPETRVDEADQLDPNVKAAIQELERVLGTRVRIVEKARHRGRIEIEYYSSEDLDRIYEKIVGEPQ